MIKTVIKFYIFFCTLSLTAQMQNIFDHEREISNKENYISEDVTFKSVYKKDSIPFWGTLIMPKGNFDRAVIIVPGSGADTRHNHYLLTEYLLENNIAVYRYDERGIGDSSGKYNRANNTISMMSAELASCLNVLRKNKLLAGKKIGFIGHSQGGMVTMDAYVNGSTPDFMVQWATPVQKHGEFLKYQIESGQNSFDDVLKYDDKAKKLEIMTALHKVVEENQSLDNWKMTKKLDKAARKLDYSPANYDRFPYLTLASEKDIVRKNFEPVYAGITIPVLYIIGSEDIFVDPVAETALLQSFANKNIQIAKVEGLNHYLTKGKLSAATMYAIDADAGMQIINWINKL